MWSDNRCSLSTAMLQCDRLLDCGRGSLSTVYNDGEISTCGEIIEVHSVQSTVMGRSQNVGRL